MSTVRRFLIDWAFDSITSKNYGSDGFSLVEDSVERAQYFGNEAGFRIVLVGAKFKYDDDGLAKGKVTDVLFIVTIE